MTDAGDPVEQAIEAAVVDLGRADAERFGELVRLGLRRLDSSAPPDVLADEVEPAAELDAADRLAWAEAFALTPLVRRANLRAEDLVGRFEAGRGDAGDPPPLPDDLRAEAEAILEELDGLELDALAEDDRRRLQRRAGEARIEARYVLSNGEGPRSLRAGRRDR